MGRDDYRDRDRGRWDDRRDGGRGNDRRDDHRGGGGGGGVDRGGSGRDRSRDRDGGRHHPYGGGGHDAHRGDARRRDDDRGKDTRDEERDAGGAATAKRAEVRRRSDETPRREQGTLVESTLNLTPSLTLPPPPRQQPLSLEELLNKKKTEADEKAKPTFISRKEREAAALKRRQEEVANARGGGGGGGDDGRHSHDVNKWARDQRREEERKRDEERRARLQERDREKELESIKNMYMGQKKEKKKVAKPSDKFKFKFDWESKEDTSRDLNELYDRTYDAPLAFGRGLRAGVDRRVQKKENSAHQMSLISKSRSDHGTAMSARERREAEDKERRDDEAYERAERKTQSEHWSDKKLEDMNERDWRIFREDFSITTKGGRLPMPMRCWEETSLLPEKILRAIQKVGYAKPSPIQMASIPIGLLKRDVIGIAETGSGKTCAFVVPMLAYIMELPVMTDEVAAHGPYALVMAPTRELAQQIEEETTKFAHFLNYRVTSVVGGQSIEDQGFKLRRGCEIVIGTPGRVIDVLERRYTVLQQCNYIVLDEADRMIDMGFEPQVMSVMDSMSADNLKPIDEAETIDAGGLEAGAAGTRYRMTYMFSATMPPSVERLARKYLRNPAVVNIGSAGKTSDLIKQVVMWMTRGAKETQLELVLSRYPDTQAIVFVNTKRAVDHVQSLCVKQGYSVASIHGGKSQDQREDSLKGFKAGEYDILVATDVAGRGIDVKDIDLVVNYEMPLVIENYTHRIGRTGRAGRQGTAVSFITSEDTDVMYDLKELLTNSGNAVPPELARHEAAKVKPQRDGKGGWGNKLTNDQLRGMQNITD